MSRRTKGVIESTMAGIRVSSVSSTTMFQGAELPGAELPGAEAPGRRPGKEKLGAARARAQSGAAARNRRRETGEVRKNELWKNEVWQFTEFINQLLKVFLRLVRPCICPGFVPGEGLEPIRKRWRSNWMTETKRRSPRAAVSRTASVLRLLPARRTNDNDLQITERQTSLRRSAASASQRVQLGRVGVGICVCVISIFSNF